MWTVEPLTVQLPVGENATGNRDVAVAAIVKSGSPNVFAGRGEKVIDWLALTIANAWVTDAAALCVASPDCDAVTVQVPAPVRCMVAPLSVQVPVAVNE